MNAMVFVYFFILLIFVTLILIGMKKSEEIHQKYFTFFLIAIALWILANTLSLLGFGAERYAYVSGAIVPLAGLLWVVKFIFPKKKIILIPFFALPFIFNPFSKDFIYDYSVFTGATLGGKVGWAFYVYSLYVVLGAVLVLLVLGYGVFHSTFPKKQQCTSIFFGILSLASLAIALNFILPIFFLISDSLTRQIALSSWTIFSLFLWNVVLKYRYLNIRVIIKKSLIKFLTINLILVLNLFLLLFMGDILQGELGMSSILSNAIIVVIVAFSFPLLQRGSSWIVDRFLKSEEWNLSERVETIQTSIASLPFLQRFAAEKSKEMETRFHLSGATFLLRDPKYQTSLSVHPSVGELILDDYHPFILLLLGSQGQVLDAGAFEQTWAEHPKEGNQEFRILHKFFKKNKVNLAIGFGQENSLAGGIMIPHRLHGVEIHDRAAIESFAREVYEDLKELLRAQEKAWNIGSNPFDVSYDGIH